jgi:hypothetical protein
MLPCVRVLAICFCSRSASRLRWQLESWPQRAAGPPTIWSKTRSPDICQRRRRCAKCSTAATMTSKAAGLGPIEGAAFLMASASARTSFLPYLSVRRDCVLSLHLRYQAFHPGGSRGRGGPRSRKSDEKGFWQENSCVTIAIRRPKLALEHPVHA